MSLSSLRVELRVEVDRSWWLVDWMLYRLRLRLVRPKGLPLLMVKM